jgi:hypothetical protein
VAFITISNVEVGVRPIHLKLTAPVV